MKKRIAIDLGGLFGYDCSDLFDRDRWIVRNSNWSKPYPEIIVFGGGEDIHPNIYNNKPALGLNYAGHPTGRHLIEMEFFRYAIQEGIPMLGICRGAQMLCALSGGVLIQDVDGHGQTHNVTDIDEHNCLMPSTHHQMMYPQGDYTLLGWAKHRGGSRTHTIPDYQEFIVDPEIVYFKNTGALCIQGHPEYTRHGSGARQMTNKWVQKLFGLEL